MKAKRIPLLAILATLFLVFATLFGFSLRTDKVKAEDAGDAYAQALVKTSVNTNFNVIRGTTYQLEKGFTSSPKTMEALVRVGEGENWKQSKGVIIGGFSVGGNEHFNMAIDTQGRPVLWWRNGEINYTADYSVPLNEWVHIVFIRDDVTDPANPTLVCYVNGVRVSSKAGIGTELQVSATNPSPAHFIGRDARLYHFFVGNINYVGLSDKAMTSSQVLSAYRNCKRLVKEGDSSTILAETCVPRTYYVAKDVLNQVPNTVTATVCIDRKNTVGLNNDYQEVPLCDAVETGVAGYIVSNDSRAGWGSSVFNTFALNVDTNGYVQVVWDPLTRGATGGEAVLTFNTKANGYTGSLDIRTGQKVHISVVRNKTAGCFDLYLNGQHASTTASNDAVKTEMVPGMTMAVGRNRNVNSKILTFPGQIYDVAFYNNAMTASQVSAEYGVSDKTTINKNKSGYNGVFVNWVLDSNQQALHYNENAKHDLKDYSGYALDAMLCTAADYFLPETDDWFVAGEDEYTMIYVPDTQCTVHSYSVLNDMMFDWMVDNKEAMNLQLVMGLGDIIDGDPLSMTPEEIAANPNYKTVAQQWDAMAANYEKLTEAGIYWNAVIGNHDYDINYIKDLKQREASLYNEHFGYNTLTSNEKRTVVSRFHTDAKTSADNDMLNVIYEYSMFTNGGTEVKYLVVALEFGPSRDVLDWANEIVSQPKYANHRVLFNTHSLVYSNGHFGGDTATANPSEYWYNLTGWQDGVTSTDGDFMWEYFISQHSNMFLTGSGHIETDTNFFRQDKGVYGNTVMSMLCDGQGINYFCTDGDNVVSWGDPLILVANENEKPKTIQYRYYNPVNNSFLGIENQLEVSFADWGRNEITASEDISLDADYAETNSTVQFIIDEQDGYVYAEPVVTSNGQTLSVSKTNRGYSFVMPNGDVRITVERFNTVFITLPDELTIGLGETMDLGAYFTGLSDLTLSVDNSNVSVDGDEITGEEIGESVLIVTSDKFGEVATCTLTVADSSSAPAPSGPSDTSDTSDTNQPTAPVMGCVASVTGASAFVLLAMLSVGFVLIKKKVR